MPRKPITPDRGITGSPFGGIPMTEENPSYEYWRAEDMRADLVRRIHEAAAAEEERRQAAGPSQVYRPLSFRGRR